MNKKLKMRNILIIGTGMLLIIVLTITLTTLIKNNNSQSPDDIQNNEHIQMPENDSNLETPNDEIMNKEIDLNKYVTVDVTGYNEYGAADVYFDYEQFIKDNKAKFNLDPNNLEEVQAFQNMLYECIRPHTTYDAIDFDSTFWLKNGDEIEIDWTIDGSLEEKYDIKFNYSIIKHTVSGLQELEIIDLFEHVTYEVIGKSGDGILVVKWNNDWPFPYHLIHHEDKIYHLENGDIITLSYTVKDCETEKEMFQYFARKGCKPLSLTKTIVVEGLEE